MTQRISTTLSQADNEIINDAHKDFFEPKIVDYFYRLSKKCFDQLYSNRFSSNRFSSFNNNLDFKFKSWNIKITHQMVSLRGRRVNRRIENYYVNKKYFFTTSTMTIKFNHWYPPSQLVANQSELEGLFSLPNLYFNYAEATDVMHHLIINEIIERYNLETKCDLESFMRKLDQVMIQNI